MNIIYLGPQNSLVAWLREQGELVTQREDAITVEDVANYDFLLSFGYRHILMSDILACFSPPFRINLHISYLPWNRGADPNFWAWMDDTLHGVTIHCLDDGLDTGPILAQQAVLLAETHTLRSSYAVLHRAIQDLFMESWPAIKSGTLTPKPQIGAGSCHCRKDRLPYERCFMDGLDWPIERVRDYVGETQAAEMYRVQFPCSEVLV